MTTVQLPYNLYFKVGEESFNLYIKDSNTKNPRLIGYYTSLNSLIRRATQIVIANKKDTLSLTTFFGEWKEVQDELTKITDQIDKF